MPPDPTPTKLLHVTTVPISLLVLINGQTTFMKNKGMEVHGASAPGPLAEQFTQKYDVPFHSVPMTREISPLKDLVSLWQLWRLMRQIKPQIVHAHTPKGGLLGMIAAWLARVPVRIYNLHGLRYSTTTGVKRRLLILMEQIAARLAHRVLCVSPSICEIALTDGLCPPDKIHILLKGSINGVDAEFGFNPVIKSSRIVADSRDRYSISLMSRVIGFVGRIVKDKGVVQLVEAWHILRDEFQDVQLVIIGPFEHEDPIPDEVRRSLEQDERVHLIGYVEPEAMPALYATMDVLAFPSYREGFPGVPLECAAMEIPIVATRIPGVVDAVVDGVTGTLIPSHDSQALANALRRYLMDESLRRTHGQQARQRVLEEFQPEMIWNEVYKTYQDLLQDKM